MFREIFSQCTSTVYHTVDGRNPAPPDRYFVIIIYKVLIKSQVVQDFFHHQHYLLSNDYALACVGFGPCLPQSYTQPIKNTAENSHGR